MTADSLKKLDLVNALSCRIDYLSSNDLERAVKTMLEIFEECFASGKRIEIRGFGSFFVSRRCSRIARNPKSGETVFISDRLVPCFRPSRLLREKLSMGK